MVDGLSAAQILDVWEVGARQHPLERALTVLAAAHHDADRAALAGLTIGQRDGLLLDLRAATFGSRLESRAACPACDEALEFALMTHDVRVDTPAIPDEGLRFEMGGWGIAFHPPTSRDLLALTGRMSAQGETPRDALLALCVIAVECDERRFGVDDLPDAVLTALIDHMGESDPQSDISLNLVCPNCGHEWSAVFDIEGYLWAEIRTRARVLLNEIHTLARAYGWREGDILSMSAARRAMYIEIVTGG